MERVKVKSASIKDGVLLIEQGGAELPADDVARICEGEADSAGFAVIGKDFAFYIVNTQPDLGATIGKLIDVTTELINVCNEATYVIGVTGGSGAPAVPVIGQMPALVAIGTEVETIKQELTDFKLR